MMKLRKIEQGLLFVAFFVCLHFLLRFWVIGADTILALCNYGGPFGVRLPSWLFVFISASTSIFLVVQWWREESFSQEWPWLLITSGGLGNILERLMYGCITDYIAFPIFPVFNLADILLTIGTIGIIIRWSRGGVENEELRIRNRDTL